MRIVLVHGSWHDGAACKPVIDELHRLGHTAEAPTVAGHGKDVSHDDCVASIVDHIVPGDSEDVVRAGRSFGGTVIARVAGEVAERIRRLVSWNVFVLEDGNCLNDEVPPHHRHAQLSSEASPTLLAQTIAEAGRD